MRETDEDLLTRYYEKLQTPATSGNKYHYIQWAKEITGVGMAKVFPLWNGDNTVKVVIIDSNRHAASQELVDEVQAYIDPESSGKGEGAAPVGAYCTIATAAEIEINVTVTIVLTNGFAMETVQSNVEEGIKNYPQRCCFCEVHCKLCSNWKQYTCYRGRRGLHESSCEWVNRFDHTWR